MANDDTKVYTMQGPGGRGNWTVYVYTNATDETAAADEAAEPDAATDEATVAPEVTPEVTTAP